MGTCSELKGKPMSLRAVHAAQILWPAFVVAGVIEMVVFAWVDPGDITLLGEHLGSQAVYSLAFFVFWALTAISGLISHWLLHANGEAVQAPSRGSVQSQQGRESRRSHRRHHRQHTRSMA